MQRLECERWLSGLGSKSVQEAEEVGEACGQVLDVSDDQTHWTCRYSGPSASPAPRRAWQRLRILQLPCAQPGPASGPQE